MSNDKSPLDKLHAEMREQELRDQRKAAEDGKFYRLQEVKRESEAKRSS